MKKQQIAFNPRCRFLNHESGFFESVSRHGCFVNKPKGFLIFFTSVKDFQAQGKTILRVPTLSYKTWNCAYYSFKGGHFGFLDPDPQNCVFLHNFCRFLNWLCGSNILLMFVQASTPAARGRGGGTGVTWRPWPPNIWNRSRNMVSTSSLKKKKIYSQYRQCFVSGSALICLSWNQVRIL
jgi:hypothetical protein